MKSRVWIAAGVALAVLAGVAFFVTRTVLGPAEDKAIALVPPDAVLYASVFVRPSTSQKMALDDLLDKFPQVGDDFEEAKDALVEVLDPQLKKIGLAFEKDVDPWLGNQIAIFFQTPGIETQGFSPDGALLFNVRNEQKAQDAVDKVLAAEDVTATSATYQGVDYSTLEGNPVVVGFINDFLVFGTEKAFKLAVDSSKGDSLSEVSAYTKATEDFEDDRIAEFYLDTRRLSGPLKRSHVFPKEAASGIDALAAAGPVALSLHARSDAVVLEASTKVPDDPALSEVISNLSSERIVSQFPSSTWLGLGIPKLGDTVEAIRDAVRRNSTGLLDDDIERAFRKETGLDLHDDVLSWMQNAGLFVEGTKIADIGGAISIESSDADKTVAAVARLREAIESSTPTTTEDAERGGLTGFSIERGLPRPIYVLGGDRFVAAFGDGALSDALDGATTLAGSERFDRSSAVLGDGYAPFVYLDLTVIPQLVETVTFFAADDPDPTYETKVKPILESLDYATIGSRREDDTVFARFVIGVR
ncbi:MAG: hypothetical protein QOH90_1805 [Actinomycetota bacterium]|nr:hypothetical protein [Actinomycetota bacterium]